MAKCKALTGSAVKGLMAASGMGWELNKPPVEICRLGISVKQTAVKNQEVKCVKCLDFDSFCSPSVNNVRKLLQLWGPCPQNPAGVLALDSFGDFRPHGPTRPPDENSWRHHTVKNSTPKLIFTVIFPPHGTVLL